jgi:hypothetical protein
MSSVPAEYAVRRTFRLSFYFWIAFVMAAYVFGGFSLAALHRYVTNDPTTMPPVVHLHGVTFISWMTLLMVQTWLINVKNVALHRSLGTFGIALGTAVLFTGSLIALLGFSRPGGSGSPFYYDLMYLSVMAMLGFGFLFTFAIRQARSNPENHRRLILFATIPLLPPGINRTYQVLFQLDYLPVVATYLTMAAIAAAILIHDRRTTHKIGVASMIGGAVVFGQMLLHFPISRSETFHEVCHFLTSLVYYR